MPNAKSIQEIISLLLQHSPADEQGAYCVAEHDILYLPGPAPEQLPQQVVAQLAELGAHWDTTLDSWACFT